MVHKILNEFKNSGINIISEKKLVEYVNFCLNNNQNKRISGKTSHHHILPQSKSCFPQFSDLKSSWYRYKRGQVDHKEMYSNYKKEILRTINGSSNRNFSSDAM